ncbi:MAG: cytochrome c family protein [Alphaproteobacteria bacterium]
MKIKMSVAVATLMMLALPLAAHAEGDAKKGEKVFKKCKICHKVGPKAKPGVGPVLNGIVGRKAATSESFMKKYSAAMKAKGAEGHVWTEENIAKYLADPKGYIPKNKMAFVGLKKEQDRADVIAYLKTFSE